MKIVLSGDRGNAPMAQWQAEFPDVEFVLATTKEAQLAAAPGADAYLGRISREAYRAAGPGLRWVHSLGAGIEKLTAIPELVESDTTIVTNTRGAHAPAIAEHTFAMLLCLTRRLYDTHDAQRAHIWRPEGVAPKLRVLDGQTMVIIGMGNIGREITRVALGFRMRVLGVDLYPGAVPEGVEAVWPLDRLDEALGRADVAVMTAPLTPETTNMLDARRIGLLRPEAYLLILSRGGITDEAALVAALKSGKLAGAATDVLAHEPPAHDDPLWDAPNLVLTPHFSGTGQLTAGHVWDITTENVRRFVRGDQLVNLCDKRAGF